MRFFMNKRWLKTGLKISIAIILLGWFLYRSDLGKIFENLFNLPLLVFLAVVILNFFYIFIKSFKWRLLLPQCSIKKLLSLSLIGQFYSLFSAGQFVGEATKIYILGKDQKETGQTAMSVIVDKITGIIGLVVVSIFGLIFTDNVLPQKAIWTFSFIVLVCLVFLFLIRLIFIYNSLINFLDFCSIKAPKFKKICGWFIEIINAWHYFSKKFGVIFICVILSIIFQLILVGSYMILGWGLDINLSFLDWCWVLGIFFGLLSLPITIGGLGVREGSLVGLLGLFAVEPERALAFSFSILGMQLIFAVIGGILELKRTRLFDFG